MQIALLVRHGQSLMNARGVVNGDPALDQGLSPLGAEEADGLARQISAFAIDLCVVTEFPRTHETADRALAGRNVPRLVDRRLNDIDVGDLEGKTLADYRSWKHAHTRDDRFPAGESLNDAARRYADALEAVLERPEQHVLVVCHEIPVRYAVNAAAGSDDVDGPLHDVANASPYVFDAAGLRRAIDGLRRLAATEHVERA